MKNRYKELCGKIIAVLILIIVIAGVLAVMTIGGGALLKAFGFEYDSTKALICFFLVYYIISLPFESIADALPKALKQLGKIKKENRVTGFVGDVIMTCLTMSLVDYFMKSVYIPEIAIFVYAMVMAAVSVYMEEKETDEEGSQN